MPRHAISASVGVSLSPNEPENRGSKTPLKSNHRLNWQPYPETSLTTKSWTLDLLQICRKCRSEISVDWMEK